MPSWSKIDWFCPDCKEYWMTTENCSPYAKIHCECECKDCHHNQAIARCKVCGQDLGPGKEPCYHVNSRSQAV